MVHIGWHTYDLHVGRYDPPTPPPGVPICPLFGTSVCQTHVGAICARYALVSITFPIDLRKSCQFGFGKYLSGELSYGMLLKTIRRTY